jgi:hypothetical protein
MTTHVQRMPVIFFGYCNPWWAWMRMGRPVTTRLR